MTPPETDLRLFLLADPDIAGLVGDRIYPDVRPQGSALPAIVYQRISKSHLYGMSEQTDIARPRIQLSIWAQTHDERADLEEKVRLRLNENPGIQILNSLWDQEPDTDRRRAVIDLAFWASEPQPA